MKNFARHIIIVVMRRMSSFYLRRNKIEVVAITGSAGKTTAKIAIGQLVEREKIYVPTESYNTDISLPLTIFREKIPSKIVSLNNWSKIIWSMCTKLFKRAPYKRIVLEMGADKPGDIAHLTSYIKPSIAVVTTVLMAHTEKFKNIETIAEEKSKLLLPLTQDNTAVLNYDDERVRAMAKMTKAKIFYIGTDKKCDLSWTHLRLTDKGVSLDLHYEGNKYQVQTKIFAPQLITSLMSAFAVGLLLGESIPEMVKRLEEFIPQAGRMRTLEGINDSIIIDDSYNANPHSTVEALKTFSGLPGRHIVIIGGMNELGEYEEEGHNEVAKILVKSADQVILIGEKSKKYYLPYLEKQGINTNFFENPTDAGYFAKNIIKKGDYVLVKGSQNGIYSEEAVKVIMKDPGKAENLLVRQTDFWIKEKEKALISTGESND